MSPTVCKTTVNSVEARIPSHTTRFVLAGDVKQGDCLIFLGLVVENKSFRAIDDPSFQYNQLTFWNGKQQFFSHNKALQIISADGRGTSLRTHFWSFIEKEYWLVAMFQMLAMVALFTVLGTLFMECKERVFNKKMSHAPVAQLDRAASFYLAGRGFESLRECQFCDGK